MRLFLPLPFVLLLACSSAPPRPPAEPSIPVIDVHTHTRFDGRPETTSKIKVTREGYLEEMRDAGVVAAISHVSETGEGFNGDLKNDKVFHCFGIGRKVDLAKLERGLKSGDYRCVKIYLGYIYRYAYDEPYRSVYRVAERYDVPVVFHTGDTYTSKGKLKYSHPMTIDEVAVDFPKVNFVIAHMGNPWTKTAAEVAYKNPNVYLEASALLIGDLGKTSPETLERTLIEPIRWALAYLEDSSKLMYGTDWPLTGMKDYLAAYKKAVPRSEWCDVFFNNAVKVFHLKEVAAKYSCKID